MGEYRKISTKDEFEKINDGECISGYKSGLRGGEKPSSLHSKSFWHGWRNGMVDGGHMRIDSEMRQLAREVVGDVLEELGIINLHENVVFH